MRIYSKILIGLMLACLVAVAVIPAVRNGPAEIPFFWVLAIGIVMNAAYLRFQHHRIVEGLERV